MYIFQCEDNPDSIFSAIYDAWDSGYGLMNVRIEVMGEQAENNNYELFTEYIKVNTDMEKAEKVVRSIRKKISEAAYEMVAYAVASDSPWKADRILRFLILGFRVGPSVVNRYGDDAVRDLFELRRFVGNELHLYTGFLRFIELDTNTLFAKFEPKSDLTAFLMPHFVNRFPDENIILYDINRQKAAIRPRGERWYMTKLPISVASELQRLEEQGGDYQSMWKAYFKHIAISERENPKLQKNVLRLHFRTHMTEFQ